VLEEFHTLVDPEVRIPPFITHLTGIDNETVRGAPVIDDAITDFTEFLGDSVLVAHNATFDYGFLSHNASFVDIELCNRRLCTRKLAVRLLPMLTSKRLEVLCQHFRIINGDQHRAMGDARATLCVFNNFVRMLRRMGIEEKRDIIRFERSSRREIIEKYGAPWRRG
jgi:DNA polymerase III epsilon subunit family exonuclease